MKWSASAPIVSDPHAGSVYPETTPMDESVPAALHAAVERMQEVMKLIQQAEALLDRAHALCNESDARLTRAVQRRSSVN